MKILYMLVILGGILAGISSALSEELPSSDFTKEDAAALSEVLLAQRALIIQNQRAAMHWQKKYQDLTDCARSKMQQDLPVAECFGAKTM